MSVGIQTSNGFVKVAGVGLGATPMIGATETTDGKAGIVPQPTAEDSKKFLRGDGEWCDINIENVNTEEILNQSKEYIDGKIELVNSSLEDKVEKISGKGLSTNDYTSEEKDKLSNIEENAQANVQSDWAVVDSSSDAFIKNKPTAMPASDVYEWAKAEEKPSYTANEVGADSKGSAASALTLAKSYTDEEIVKLEIPSSLSELNDDTNHRTVTDEEKNIWNTKSDFSGNYNDLTNKPSIPTKVSELINDAGYKTTDNNTTYTFSVSENNATNGNVKIKLIDSNFKSNEILIKGSGDVTVTTSSSGEIVVNSNASSVNSGNTIYNNEEPENVNKGITWIE